jgi:hypothetical protein
MIRSSFVCLLSGIVGMVSLAKAGPVSNCASNTGAPGFTCNIFETNVDGTASETSNILTLPSPVGAGFLVLMESPTGDQNDQTQWSDVVQFIDGGNGIATTLRFFSDTGAFPSLQTVQNGPSQFITEVQTGTGSDFTDSTLFTATTNGVTATYNIFSGAPVNENEGGGVTTPEPASIALFGLGFIALIVRARKRLRAA